MKDHPGTASRANALPRRFGPPAGVPSARFVGPAAFAASAALLAASGAHWGWQIGAWAHLVPAATGFQALDFALLALAFSAFFAFAPARFARRAVPAALLAALLPEGTDPARVSGVQKQLAFLLDRGHLIEFTSGKLALPQARHDAPAQKEKEEEAK